MWCLDFTDVSNNGLQATGFKHFFSGESKGPKSVFAWPDVNICYQFLSSLEEWNQSHQNSQCSCVRYMVELYLRNPNFYLVISGLVPQAVAAFFCWLATCPFFLVIEVTSAVSFIASPHKIELNVSPGCELDDYFTSKNIYDISRCQTFQLEMLGRIYSIIVKLYKLYSTIIPLNDSFFRIPEWSARRSQRSMNWRSSHLADLGRFRWGINWGFWVEIAGVDTLWLCQNSYWTWPFIDDFPIKDGDFP